VTEDLVVEGSPEDLEQLRELLEQEFGANAAVQPVTSSEAGQLREPILIALVIALGGPVITREIAKVIRRFMEHREAMKGLDQDLRRAEMDHEFRMALVGADDEERPVTLDELELPPS